MPTPTFSDTLLATARKLGSATLHEAGGKKGALPSRIKPLRDGWRIAAPVFTVVGPARDNLWPHRAIYAAPRGSVLLHECSGDAEAGYWGGIMANAAMVCGLAGLVTEGGVRDVEELRGLDWPIFAANVCIRGTTKRPDGQGSLGASALFGEILVHTGDLLVGDADGLVIIAAADAERVVAAGVAREDEEREIVARLKGGENTLDIYKLPRGG
ncbi:MAG: 4-hydroxy-4-methyl-2-oxoglutarate aldolase [Pseudomonadota bacterium]